MGLILGRTHTTIRLAGDIDIVSADDLNSLLARLESITMAISVEMSGVHFLDSSGIGPLMETVRLRQCEGLGEIGLAGRSRQVQFFLDVSKLGGDPHLDLAAWDRLDKPFPAPPVPHQERQRLVED
jgi:anti-anti-sigma factor